MSGLLKNALSMAGSTCVLSAIVHPFDLIRTRRQAMVRQRYLEDGILEDDRDWIELTASEEPREDVPKREVHHISYSEAIGLIYADAGLGGFYRGWLLVGIANFLSYFLFIYYYEWMVLVYGDNVPKLLINLFCGLTLQAVVQPLWVAVAKVSACHSIPELFDLDQYYPLKSLYVIAKRQGWKALWSGLRWQLLLSVSHIQYTIYSAVRDWATSTSSSDSIPVPSMMKTTLVIIGSTVLAQCVTTAVLTPLVTLKTERQIKGSNEVDNPRKHFSILGTLKWYFSGYTMLVSKSLVSKVLKYLLYELFREIL